MNSIFELIKTILGFFDTQLVTIFSALRIKKPTVYLSVVSILIGGSHYIDEAVKTGVLKLSETGVFLVWVVSFLLSILMRPALGTQSIDTPYMKISDDFVKKPKSIN